MDISLLCTHSNQHALGKKHYSVHAILKIKNFVFSRRKVKENTIGGISELQINVSSPLGILAKYLSKVIK